MMFSIAYRQGFQQARRGGYANPYPVGTAQHNDFEQGYWQARKRGIEPLSRMAAALLAARRARK
ncbi:hypothetical protein [Pseudomonas aeruginosa]|uniref:hypothetical protein n=2 Tax=Pseudomonas aeruginosa TaxID=287 RepID=UPI001588CADE|nr:hypothetical protein [Pseudomonas aeruginosa]MCH0827916.1 hypothetical protein [Pseudomonas aeruginosa]MCH0834198.1 hypothetical protein [Pseudomonas aeruginosa]MCH0840478.1 hypothetical protein [Pseudomonas aeruginosa]MCH0846746.1 hypothetical protein [Pseudomonas aeruginosa]MCH0853018.1 hypothetical protein [Pseudomonas aeruginosa]